MLNQICTQAFVPKKTTPTTASRVASRGNLLQRKCACGGNPGASGECEQCRRRKMSLQRQAWSAATPQGIPPIVHEVLRSSGQPLDAETRAFMEPRFGHDFGQVRVHAGARAAESAMAVNALAYTTGKHVVFGMNQYTPGTPDGRRLLAHELTHVVQQSGKDAPASYMQPILDRPGDAYEREADRIAESLAGDPAPGVASRVDLRITGSATAPQLQRRLRVIDPGSPATYLPPPDNTRPRADLVQGWLRQMCSTGAWTVDRGSGEVTAANQADVCTGGTGGSAAPGATPISCSCLCRAIDPATRAIDIMVRETLNYDYFVFDQNLGIYTLRSDVANTGSSGEGLTILPDEGAWITNTAVVLSGRSTTLAGVGDTSRPGQARISDPPWLILAHEICGHLGVRDARGGDEYEHVETPSGDRSAVDIENRIRREHSTTRQSLGIRSGDTGRIPGAIYVVAAGETFASVSRRLGMSTGPAAFGVEGHHRRILHWPSGDQISREDTSALFTAGQELFIEGIHWHQVIANETWASIATMWGIPSASLRRANPGVTLQPGTRLLIPVR